LDVSSASESALSKAKDFDSQISLLKLNMIAIDQLKDDIVKGKDNVNLNFTAGSGTTDAQLSDFITRLNNLLLQKNALLKTYKANSQPLQETDQQILQVKAN